MNEFEYLAHLPLTNSQRDELVKQGLYPTPLKLYQALTGNPRGFQRFLWPLDVTAVRGILWKLLTPKQQKSFEPTTGERVSSAVGIAVGLGIVMTIFMLFASSCSQMFR